MKITIITITFNSREYLEDTIKSVLAQDYSELEYLIIDGGSTDGTIDLVKAYADKDSRIRWISEPDQGIADAMNKGIRLATGDIIAHLHSDDYYLPGTLSRVAGVFAENPSIKWVTGRCRVMDGDGRVLFDTRIQDSYSFKKLGKQNSIAHPSTFLRKEIFDEVGVFSLDRRFAMDYHLWLRIAKKHEPFAINEVLSVFRAHGQSLSTTNAVLALKEEYEIWNEIVAGSSRGERVLRFLRVQKECLLVRLGIANLRKKIAKKLQLMMPR